MRKALLATLCILAFAMASAVNTAANEYRIVDLGANTRAWGMNNRNQVVGTIHKGNGEYRGFIWDTAGGMREIGTLGGTYSHPVDINDSGQVVGWTQTETGAYCEFVWDQAHGMQRWAHPGIPYINKLIGINDSGQIAAVSVEQGAFVWDNGSVATVAGPEYYGGEAFNNYGQMIGSCMHDGNTYSFLFDPTTGVQWIPQPRTQSNSAVDINDNGQAVGTAFGLGDSEFAWGMRGFVWDSKNGMTLIDVADSNETFANGINNEGYVVGHYWGSGKSQGYIWNRESGMYILPALENLSTRGQRINDNGWIIGYVSDGVQDRAVIWEPVPEPASIVALGVGVAGLLCSCRRRKTVI